MKRPLAVSIVVGFLFAATLIAFLVATALLHPTQFTDWLFTLNPHARAGFEMLGWIASALLYALGGGTLVAGIELRRGRRWAWRFALILFIVNMAGDGVALFTIHDWMRSGAGVLVGLLFALVLLQPGVMNYCRN